MKPRKCPAATSAVLLCAGLLWLPTAAVAQECLPPPEGLISWWPADGNADDVEGVNDGTLVGASFDTSIVTSGTGQAFRFDGIDDFVEVPHHSSLDFTTSGDDAVTVAYWILLDSYPAGDTANHSGIVGKAGDAYYTGIDGGPDPDPDEWGIFTKGGNLDLADCSTPSLGVWYHYVGIYDEGNDLGQIYINGSLDCSRTITDDSDGSTESFYIGSAAEIVFFDGLIDEVAVFARVLTAAEIQAMYDAGPAGLCKDEDGDGFRPPEDCDDTDPAIHPDAQEIILNFVDENCDGNLGECDPCSDWANHGAYVRCVSDVVGDCSVHSFTPEEADGLVQSAALSSIGKKGFVPPECQ